MRIAAIALAALLVPALCLAAAGNWEYDIEVADSLLQHGYLDAAQEDYQKIIATYAQVTPAVDRGWLGLSKVYDARGDLTRTKTCLEQVLERNADPASMDTARQMYIHGKQLADNELAESERAVQYFEFNYHNTSWLDLFNKLWVYFDLRKARKAKTEKEDFTKSFDPRHLIPPVVDTLPTADPASYQVSPQDFAEVLNMVPEEKIASLPADPAPATTVVPAEPVKTITPSLTVDQEVAELKAKREAYLAAYRSLQSTIQSKNQVAIQQATTAFQKAVAEYNSARAAVAAKK